MRLWEGDPRDRLTVDEDKPDRMHRPAHQDERIGTDAGSR
jgi:hypothetical protein